MNQTNVTKKAGARLFDFRSCRPLQGHVSGNTSVFELLHRPPTYNVSAFRMTKLADRRTIK
jgi:hypothetical protein